MSILELKRQLSAFVVFSLSDIRKLEPGFDRRRLSEWQKKGYIRMVRSGYYIFSDLEISEEILFLVANVVYPPSYVSLESALSYYGLIPEGVYTVTSVSTRKTESFVSGVGNFSYRSLRDPLCFGYQLVEARGRKFKIAEIEKAVLDFLYLNPRLSDADSLSGWRFNFDVFHEAFDMEKFLNYMHNFNSPSLTRRAKRFLKYVEKQNANT